MKKQIVAGALAVGLLLGLSACGGNTAADTGGLQEENEALRQQVAELEEACQALSDEKDQLLALNSDQEAVTGEEPDNMIDRFFEDVEGGESTAEMNFIANSWADAWEAEARNVAEWLKLQLPLEEDRALVDSYLVAAEEQAERLNTMAIYPVADLEVPQEERVMYSGTMRGVLWAGSRQRLWRDTFYQLLNVAPKYDGTFMGDSYPFLFSSGEIQARIDEIRADN